METVVPSGPAELVDAGSFLEQELAFLRVGFCRWLDPKKWAWELAGLKSAILAVNEDMMSRGVALSLEKQRAILRTVWAVVREHGPVTEDAAREVHSWGRYLWKAVHEHMVHNGPRYYMQWKTADAKATGDLAQRVMHEVRVRKAQVDAAHLQAIKRGVAAGRQRGGRGGGGDSGQGDLFGDLKTDKPLADRHFGAGNRPNRQKGGGGS